MRKRVGLTFRLKRKAEPYEAALLMVGLEPAPITPEEPWQSVTGLDALLISGGTDINPKYYGKPAHRRTPRELDDARDELEMLLLKQALRRDLPTLAVCRGLQMFNVVHGGTLVQHLTTAATHRSKLMHAHTVFVEPGTKLAAILGEGEHSVNSRHHQAVSRVGRAVVVSARAADGVIEGLERPDKKFAVAVQWHPEDRVAVDAKDRRLFEAFAAATVDGSAR